MVVWLCGGVATEMGAVGTRGMGRTVGGASHRRRGYRDDIWG